MKINCVDLNRQHALLDRSIEYALKRVLGRGDFILGTEVKQFEREFSALCGCSYAIGVSSGTAALFLALESLGIGEGDEVIVPDFTYIATALAVSYTGAKPAFCEINEDTYCMSPDAMCRCITVRTKAVIPVHLFGQCADMTSIMGIAKRHNLKVVEDAAQAHAAQTRIGDTWHSAGGIGNLGCFSFYPTKNLGGIGDGGMITTNDSKLNDTIRLLRDYGRVSRYEHHTIGYNERLDTIQAAVLRVKLKKLQLWNRMRQEIADNYTKQFSPYEAIITPFVAEYNRHMFHVYPIRVPRRDKVIEELRKKGITALVHYPIPLHQQKVYAGLEYKKGDFPVSEAVAESILSLPIFPYMTKKEIDYVARTVIRTVTGKL